MNNNSLNSVIDEPNFSCLVPGESHQETPQNSSTSVDLSLATGAAMLPNLNKSQSSSDTEQFPDESSIDQNGEIQTTETVSMLPGTRPMQKRRFLSGLLFSSLGIALMLMVAVGTLHGFGIRGRLSLPVIGLCMIFGLMMLGGGFGVMATAAPSFDDGEFDRLMQDDKNDRMKQ